MKYLSKPILRLLCGLLMFLNSACAFAPRFSGPKYDSKTKKLLVDPDQEVVLALTNAKLIRGQRSGFDSKSREIVEKIKTYEGYIGGTVKVQILGDEVWTMTVWENEAALKKFVDSRQHLDAMYLTNQAMKKFRSLNVKVLAKDLPYSWETAQTLLDSVPLRDHKPF